MKYTYFDITNFKGIHRLRLDLAATPASTVYALVGLNESGKTTILEALSYFEFGRSDVQSVFGTVRSEPEDLIPIARRSNFSDTVTIEAGVLLDDDDVDALNSHLRDRSYRLVSIAGPAFPVRHTIAFTDSRFDRDRTVERNWGFTIQVETGDDTRIALHADSDEWHDATEFLRARLPVIRFFPNFLFDFPARIYLEPSTGDTKEAFYRDLVRGIVDSLAIDATIERHLVARARSGDPGDRRGLEAMLHAMSGQVTERLFGAWSKMLPRDAGNRKEVIIDLGDDPDERVYVRFRIKDGDGHYELSERSLGFRWFFVYLLLTTYAGSLSAGGRPILYLFDEPASNLHPSAQAQLLRSFARLGQESLVVYATHSHHLIDPDWLESAYIVRNAAAEPDRFEDATAVQTDITLDRYRTFAAAHPDQTRYFQPILDVLDYRPSRLELVPGAVMVEGKTDSYLLSYFQRVLGLMPQLAYMPGGGAGALDVPIRLYLGWSRPFVVLLDGDREGVRQRERYIGLFGPAVEARLTTITDAVPGARGGDVESLVTDEDRLALQRFSYAGDVKDLKTHLHRAVQELAMTAKSVPTSETTNDNIRALHAHLAGLLAQVQRTLHVAQHREGA